jgi:hypothetical protein
MASDESLARRSGNDLNGGTFGCGKMVELPSPRLCQPSQTHQKGKANGVHGIGHVLTS